jgi:hypothetical protein
MYAWPTLGYDFGHNFMAVNFWLGGGNPYTTGFGDARGVFAYPPVVLLMFAWCYQMEPSVAYLIWIVLIAGTVVWGVAESRRFRLETGGRPFPLPLGAALALLSLPVIFAMERGNADAAVLLLLLFTVVSLRWERRVAGEVLAGAALALAAWIKVYPAALLFAILVLRRYWGFLAGIVTAAIIGLAPLRYTRMFIHAVQTSQGDRVRVLDATFRWLHGEPPVAMPSHYPVLHISAHSISSFWPMFWQAWDVRWLANMPGILAGALFLAIPVTWVCWKVFRSPQRGAFAYPYFLWMAAAATYWMPISYDYNLIFLPLLLLAVWRARDPLYLQLFLVLSLWWLQPVATHFEGDATILFLVKVVALWATCAALIRRISDDREIKERGADHPSEPRFAETGRNKLDSLEPA